MEVGYSVEIQWSFSRNSIVTNGQITIETTQPLDDLAKF